MPHQANRLIVERMEAKGWLREPRNSDLPSDNWWLVEDAQGQTALLYVVRFMSGSARGEPKEIPNEPALPRIGKVHTQKGLGTGPFIALAKVSDPGATPDIVSIRVWRLSSKHLTGAKRMSVEDLGTPIFAC